MTTNDIQRLAAFLKPTTLVAVIHDLHDSECNEFTETAASDMIDALFANVGEDEADRMLDERRVQTSTVIV